MTDVQNIKTDEICDDPKIAEVKEKQMGKFKKHSMLGSVADSCKFLAGPLFAIGISTMIVGTVAPAISITLLAVAAVSLAVGIACSYTAANIWADGQFNNYEISAKSTAHHIAQELHVDNPSPFENKGRTDGKSWRQIATASKTTSEMRVRA